MVPWYTSRHRKRRMVDCLSVVSRRSTTAATSARELASVRACSALLAGTNLTSITEVSRTKPTRVSLRSDIVFNLGAFKTGSTSLQAALAQSGITPACKTAWGEPEQARSRESFDLSRQSFDLLSVARFSAAPLTSDTLLTSVVQNGGKCRYRERSQSTGLRGEKNRKAPTERNARTLGSSSH